MKMTHSPVTNGVAAAHPVTAAAGASALRRGGSAIDAAVSMLLVACAAETLFTGLSGGGFATVYDAETKEVTSVDFFVAMPGLGERQPGKGNPIEVFLGGQAMPYDIGAATVAVPGVPAGARHLWQRWGRLPWADLVQPALVASYGTPFPKAHAELLPAVEAAMCVGEGERVFTRDGGGFLQAGDPLFHPEHWRAFQTLIDAPESFYRGDFADAMLAVSADGGGLSQADLDAYRVLETKPREISLDSIDGPVTVHARGDDLDDVLGTLVAASGVDQDPTTDPQAALDLTTALRAFPKHAETTNLVAVDEQQNACVITVSLGLGSTLYVPGYGVHLNSMLGEGELQRHELSPGMRIHSMMSPLVVLDEQRRLLAAAGAAGGSRIRPALVQTLIRMLRGMDPQTAIDLPRLAALPNDVVRIEPGFSPEVLTALREHGNTLFQTETPLPYFGGVSAASIRGMGADPRRSGEAIVVA